MGVVPMFESCACIVRESIEEEIRLILKGGPGKTAREKKL